MAKNKDALDPAKMEEDRQKNFDAELGVARARVDGEAGVAALRLRGMEAEEAMLGYERQKLELARERGRMGQEEYRRQGAVLKAREDALSRETRERRGAHRSPSRRDGNVRRMLLQPWH